MSRARDTDRAWTPADGLASARRGLIASAWMTLAFVLVFSIAPQLDLRLSALFFDAHANPPVFPYDRAEWMVEFTRITLLAANVALAIAVCWWVFELFRPSRRRLQVTIVALSLVLGPGLVVNEVLKPLWSRARPRDTTLFAGDQHFTPVYRLPGDCSRNCSFPSGHGGAAFAPLVGIFVSRRRRWLWCGLASGGAIGYARLLSGSHFLSDILASGIIVVAVSSLVTLLVILHDSRRRQRTRTSDPHAGPGR
ncbi:MAG: phosphatase PAP2 family protein [Lautropia sp.]